MITVQEAYDHTDEIRILFTEYTKMLVEADARFSSYLELQNYDEEYLHPAEKYRKPEGRLYIVLDEGHPVGCIGFRKLDDARCEMKRLYVRKEYRGQGIARNLVERILKDAQEAGYREMYLDTLPQLQDALRLYERFAFETTDRYNDSPLDTTIFMKKAL
ncbi:MAG: GNAT family N-acetyltransferase [Solobacterium sp.]|nr:GNAT family N-acetyltransferase [Solobacterium sp.]